MADIGTLLAPEGVLLYLDEIQYFNKKQQQSLLEFMEDGRITQVRLHPISLGMGQPRTRRGTPVPGDEGVLRHLAELSRPFGTNIRIEDNIGYIDL